MTAHEKADIVFERHFRSGWHMTREMAKTCALLELQGRLITCDDLKVDKDFCPVRDEIIKMQSILNEY